MVLSGYSPFRRTFSGVVQWIQLAAGAVVFAAYWRRFGCLTGAFTVNGVPSRPGD